MRIVFMGSPVEVISPAAELLKQSAAHNLDLVGVVSQPPRPVGRGGSVQDPPLAAWAKNQNIPCLQPESAKASDFLHALRSLKPDVIVTAAYGQILSQELIDIPTRAIINIHPSDLPKYRGATPVPQAIMDGQTKTAVTILFTVKKLDAGPIILSRTFDIQPQETAGELTKRLFEESGPLLIKAINQLRDKSFNGSPQNEAEVSFCKKIEKDDGQIDWNQSGQEIYNRFRAYQPWPGTWVLFGEKRIVLEDLTLTTQAASKPAGTIEWRKSEKSLYMHTTDFLICVKRLKPAGGKSMDASSFWNGLKSVQKEGDVRFV